MSWRYSRRVGRHVGFPEATGFDPRCPGSRLIKRKRLETTRLFVHLYGGCICENDSMSVVGGFMSSSRAISAGRHVRLGFSWAGGPTPIVAGQHCPGIVVDRRPKE